MVFTPLADCKVQLFNMGMVEWRSGRLLSSCWVVVRKSDWMTRLTRCRVLYQSKTSSIMTCWSCHYCATSPHHHTIWWWVMRSNRYWIGPSLSPGICQVSITFFSSHDPFLLCFIIFFLILCHMPLSLLILGLIPFPRWCFPFCLCWFICSHDPLHFLNNLTNRSHPLCCLWSLLLFYLWVAHLWSSVMATLFVLKLY